MRTFGIVLVVAGLALLLFNGFNFTTKEKVADIGPIEINKTENKTVAWPSYAGIVVIIAGIAVVALGGKKAGK